MSEKKERMFLDQNIIILICIIIGCILRTLVPYLKKMSAEEIKKFDAKFFGTFMLALLLGIVAGITIFPTFIAPAGTLFTIVLAALMWGWGSQSVINNLANL